MEKTPEYSGTGYSVEIGASGWLGLELDLEGVLVLMLWRWGWWCAALLCRGSLAGLELGLELGLGLGLGLRLGVAVNGLRVLHLLHWRHLHEGMRAWWLGWELLVHRHVRH